MLGSDEGDEARILSRKEEDHRLEVERRSLYRAIQEYAAQNLRNVRFCFSLYNNLYVQMKEGSAGWGRGWRPPRPSTPCTWTG